MARLLAVLIGLVGNAWGGVTDEGWVLIDESPLATFYVHPKSLEIDTRQMAGDPAFRIKVTGWFLIDYRLKNMRPNSAMYRIEDDCLERKQRNLAVIAFDNPQARGAPQFVATTPQKWITEDDTGFQYKRWLSSCSNKGG